MSYSDSEGTHEIKSSSIIASSSCKAEPTVFFLQDSRLHSLTGDILSNVVDELSPAPLEEDVEGHLIVSILSGSCQAEQFYDGVIAPLLDHFERTDRYKVHKTTSSTSVIELARDVLLPAAIQGRKQHVILLSGDGGIVDIINELLGPEALPENFVPPVISLIPMGTGNALAHSTKIFDGTNGLAAWLRGRPRNLPLIRATFSHDRDGAKLLSDEGRKQEELVKKGANESYFWGAVVFSWGFHAQIVADSDTPEFRKHGVERFKMAAQEALFPSDGAGPHKYQGSLTVQARGDGHSIQWDKLGGSEHCYVLGTLVSNLEETFTISPLSTPFNEEIRLVHIGHKSGEEIMRIMGLAYQKGKHIEDKQVDYKDVEGFSVRFDEDEEKWRRVCIDGKIILVEKGGSVEIKRETRVAVQLSSLT